MVVFLFIYFLFPCLNIRMKEGCKKELVLKIFRKKNSRHPICDVGFNWRKVNGAARAVVAVKVVNVAT